MINFEYVESLEPSNINENVKEDNKKKTFSGNPGILILSGKLKNTKLNVF
jgi:hypothetical protein